MSNVVSLNRKRRRNRRIMATVGQSVLLAYRAQQQDEGQRRSILMAAFVDALRAFVASEASGDMVASRERRQAMQVVGAELQALNEVMRARRKLEQV